jgi:hypothetical protein
MMMREEDDDSGGGGGNDDDRMPRFKRLTPLPKRYPGQLIMRCIIARDLVMWTCDHNLQF